MCWCSCRGLEWVHRGLCGGRVTSHLTLCESSSSTYCSSHQLVQVPWRVRSFFPSLIFLLPSSLSLFLSLSLHAHLSVFSIQVNHWHIWIDSGTTVYRAWMYLLVQGMDRSSSLLLCVSVHPAPFGGSRGVGWSTGIVLPNVSDVPIPIRETTACTLKKWGKRTQESTYAVWRTANTSSQKEYFSGSSKVSHKRENT